MRAITSIRYAIAALADFLPMILLTLLALASFLLYQLAPSSTAPKTSQAKSLDPDYFLDNFSARHYDASGVLRSEIFGESATHYPSTDQLEIKTIRFKRSTDEGRTLVGTASRALSNQDQTTVELFDNAQIALSSTVETASQETLSFFSHHLRVLTNQKKISSDLPVTVRRGADWFKSNTMQYDHATHVLNLKGNVTLTLHPR